MDFKKRYTPKPSERIRRLEERLELTIQFLDEELDWVYERLNDQNNGFVELSKRIEKLEKEVLNAI